MTESSMPWDGVDTGDAVGSAPYDTKSELAAFYMSLIGRDEKGFVTNEDNKLAVTSGVNLVNVATGKAIVWGTRYKSDAIVEHEILTPTVSTRVDTIVLRKEWNGQLIRQQKLTGTEGAGVPALTETEGVTWELPLADVSITTGGVITLTDRRVLAPDVLAGTGTSNNPARADHSHGDSLVIKTADENRSSVTLLDDTDLVAAVLSGITYKFRFMLVFTESLAATDLSIDVIVPGSSELVCFVYGLDASDALALKTLLNTDDWGAAAAVRAIFVEGVLVAGGNGNLQLQWAAANASGGNLTLKENSSLVVT